MYSDVVEGLWIFSVFTSAHWKTAVAVRGINAEGQGEMPRKKIDAAGRVCQGLWCQGSGIYRNRSLTVH